MNATARYLIRAVKSLIWFVILFAIIVTIIVLITPEYTFDMVFMKEGGLFKPNSQYQIIALFTAIAAIYPAVKYVKKEAVLHGSFSENRMLIIHEFEALGYELSDENEEVMKFRLKNGFTRFMRMFEDEITLTKGENPVIFSGDRKEILRISGRIAYRSSMEHPDDQTSDEQKPERS